MLNLKKYSINQNIKEISFLLPIFCYFLFFSGIIFTPIYLWYLKIYPVAICLVTAITTVPLILLINKQSKTKILPSNLLVFVYYIALFYISSVTGDLSSAASFWLLSIPLVANLILPPLYSFSWLILTLVGCMYLYYFPAQDTFSLTGSKLEIVRIFTILFAIGLVYILTLIQKLKIDELSSLALKAELESQKLSLYENNLNEAIDLAHKINNPLTAILLLSKRLQKTCDGSQTVHLKAIEAEALRASTKARSLVKLSEKKLIQDDQLNS
jgi:signal transduction histidine kinase